MMKHFLKIIIFCIYACVVTCNLTNANIVHETSQLSDLIDDFKNYKTTNTTFHSGNLYQHSLWVSIAIHEWFKNNVQWTEGLDEHAYRIATIAGLLHDVGKAGDLCFEFYTKPDHCVRGQDYVLGKQTYVLRNGTTIFNFEKFFNNLGFTQNDRKVVSILIGAHHLLGDLLQHLSWDNVGSCANDIAPYLNSFKQQLQACAFYAGFNYSINEKLLRLVLLVSAADVKGAQRVIFSQPFSIAGYSIHASPSIVYFSVPDMFDALGYATRGLFIRQMIV